MWEAILNQKGNQGETFVESWVLIKPTIDEQDIWRDPLCSGYSSSQSSQKVHEHDDFRQQNLCQCYRDSHVFSVYNTDRRSLK